MRALINLPIYILLFFCSTLGYAQKLYYYHDTTGKLDIQRIKTEPIPWIPLSQQVLDFGFVKQDIIWVKVENQIKIKKEVIVIPNASLDNVTFFSNGKIYQTGDRVYNPAFFYPFPVFELNDSVVHIRIQKLISTLRIPIAIKSRDQFLKNQNLYLNVDVLLLGILAAFWIFSLTMYFFSKSNIFLFFSLYIVTTILYYYTSNGILKATFFPTFLYFSEVRLITSCIAPVTLFWFNRSLISYDTKFIKTLSSYLWKCIFLLVIASIFFVEIIKNNFLQLYIAIIYLFAFILVIILFFLNIREVFVNQKNAKKRYAYLFLGSIIITILLFLLESMKVNWLPDFDILLLITCTEIIIFGMLISIDFFKSYRDNEKYALNLLESKKRALDELRTIQFKERKKISAVLHNRYQSQLTGVRLYLKNILSPNDPIIENLRNYEEEIRLFSHQILPKELENGLFNDALTKQISFLNLFYKEKKFHFSKFDVPDRLNEKWIYDLYLIISELFQNSVKHSNGDAFLIEFYAHPKEYVLTYSDNGNNFDSAKFNIGHGAHLIFDQIEHIGARFKLEANPQLFVIIEIPRK